MAQVQGQGYSLNGAGDIILREVSRSELKQGDRIISCRGRGLHNRHGIYIGKRGCEVIRHCGITTNFSQNGSCTLDEFLRGSQLCQVVSDASNHDDSHERAGLIFHYVSKKELKPGDHIYCYRGLILYSHHGIYIGEEGCEVIHFNGPKKKLSRIRSCTLDEFLKGAQLRLVAYDASFLEARLKRSETTHAKKSDPASTVIERAKYYLRNPEQWEDYNLLFNNCETFAVYCKTGQSISKQIVGGIVGDIE